MSKTLKPSALTKIILDTRRRLMDGSFPVKIRVTFQRKQIYYPTPYNLSKEDFAIVTGSVLNPEEKKAELKELKRLKIEPIQKISKSLLKDISLELQAYENKAAGIVKKLPVFTFDLFEKYLLTNRVENNLISKAFDIQINELRKNDQIGTATAYECAKKSIGSFRKNIRFTDVTPDFLRMYEKWMLENERSLTTISMYLRNLRTIFNNAISENLIPKEIYPFGKNRYEIPTGSNKKKAITLQEIALIYNYEATPGTTRAMARDFWVFMYLCNGMNMKDMCLLKFKNIKGNILEFKRAKTVRTKRDVELIRVVITEDVERIINEYGNEDKDPNNYIFPVLKKKLKAERERQLIQQITHVVNDHTKEIAKELGIEKKLTTYAARHSFATILQRSGVSTSFISEALGHSNETTTQNYLAGFEDHQKIEAVKALTAFKKNSNRN